MEYQACKILRTTGVPVWGPVDTKTKMPLVLLLGVYVDVVRTDLDPCPRCDRLSPFRSWANESRIMRNHTSSVNNGDNLKFIR